MPSSGSVVWPCWAEFDDDVGDLRLVHFEVLAFAVAPACQIDDNPFHLAALLGFNRFDDVEASVVEEEGVVAEPLAQLRDCRMRLWKDLGVELGSTSSRPSQQLISSPTPLLFAVDGLIPPIRRPCPPTAKSRYRSRYQE